MKELPHTHSCFVCGESNSIGLQLRFQTDGSKVRTEFAPRIEHAGFQETVHGGIISTVLDEIMVWACAVQAGQFAYCAELTVRFVAPARPGHSAMITAELVSNKRNRLFEAKAEWRDAHGNLLASGTGKYLPIPKSDEAKLAQDLVGDFSGLRAIGLTPET